jgi:site-specific DNA-methyltransferase (adenine-specific)
MRKKQTFKQEHHPTEKPNDLYRWLIERYCPVGGTVLDPTFGSGNSVFTSYEMGRNAIGIEMNEGFFNKAVERLELP